MCYDACSRQAIVSGMYTVHMLGEGESLTHTFRHTCCKHKRVHHQSLGGYKAVVYSKNPPIRAGVYCSVIPWGEVETRAYVGGWWL